MNEEFEELYAAPEKKKKKSDPGICILMLQFTACLILATAAICIRFFGGTFYEEVRTRYILMFEDDTSVQEVLSALSPRTENGAVSEEEGTISFSSTPVESSLVEEASSSEPSAAVEETGGEDGEGEKSRGEAVASASVGTAVQTAAEYTALNHTAFSFDKVNRYAAWSAANALFMPTAGTVSSEYGYRVNPVTGLYTLHAGIDLAAEEGTPVYSALAGRVTAVGENASYGIYIEVEHSDGVSTLYAHLQAAKVKEGVTVRRGGLIGLVGSTGRSTGPHLHFEVTVGGQTLNPRYLLPALEDS